MIFSIGEEVFCLNLGVLIELLVISDANDVDLLLAFTLQFKFTSNSINIPKFKQKT